MNWNLKMIYEDDKDWESDLKSLKKDTEDYKAFEGKLNNKEDIEKFFLLDAEVDKKLSRLYSYAAMKYDLNQKNVKSQDAHGRIYAAYNNFVASASFVTPEMIKVNREDFNKWISESKIIAEHAYQIDRMYRNKEHIFDAKSELIMANYSQALGTFNMLYDQLAVADNYAVDVKLSTGEMVSINHSNFRMYLEELDNPNDRKNVFEAVFKYFEKHKNTFAGIYNGIIQSSIADVRNRNYSSVLESYLYSNAIPTSVYETLIETTKSHTSAVKKYYKIRKKFFKLDKIHTYDRFLSFAKSDVKYDFSKVKEMFLDATKEVGGEFYEMSKQVLVDGRVDVDIKEGKRTGAYSTSTYEAGPFILLNHSGTLDDAFTIVHEAGHSMHTLFSYKAQPYATANYVIFVAEIASTFNEQLFLDYMMEHTDDKNTKLVLLQQAIDGLLGTFYRQSLFADYEYQANRLAEAGETITCDVLSNIMKDLYKKYYDIDIIDEEYKEYVWAYIPHFFHSPFYVYQYATSYASSLAIYDAVKNKKDGAFDKYINLLKAGGSDYPINLVKEAGVDLTTEKPFMSVVKRLEELVDKLEETLEE